MGNRLYNLAEVGGARRRFWGMLFDLLFFVPLLGAATGAGIGALSRSMANVGIEDNFIDGVKQRVTPGTSAPFPPHLRRGGRPGQGQY